MGRRAASKAPSTCRSTSSPPRADELGEGPIVFYCAVGERSLMAAQALAGAGREAVSLAGGIAAWQQAGLPAHDPNNPAKPLLH